MPTTAEIEALGRKGRRRWPGWLALGVLAAMVLGALWWWQERSGAQAVAYVTGPGGRRLERCGHETRFRMDRSGFEEDGETFVAIHNPPLRLIVVGAVHIAQALVPIARVAGYDPVLIDPEKIQRVLYNLLSNAIKFNKSGGQVIVSTALEDTGEVYLRVRDTGTGMSAKDLAAALEPFRQVHTARHGGGTGLGLPLTKALVEANRASFHIDSTPGQGTLVEISFPSQRVLAE